MRTFFRPLAFLAILASVGLVRNATAVITQTGTSSSGTFTVLSGLGDLADGLTPSVNNIGFLGFEGKSNDTKVLTNGTFGTVGVGVAGEIVTIGNGAELTFTLNTAASPLGFRLDKIDSYTGWSDTGRVSQNYDVSYSTVLLPNTFVSLTSVNYIGTNVSTKVVVEDSLNAPLATGIAKLRFSFPTVQNTYVGYREIDLEGVWLPEPTSVGLILCGWIGLLARRRRVAR